MSVIPARQTEVQPENKRFYVHSNTLVHLELQKEAYRRGLNAWDLGGLVIQQWIEAGFPSLSPVNKEPQTTDEPSELVSEFSNGGHL